MVARRRRLYGAAFLSTIGVATVLSFSNHAPVHSRRRPPSPHRRSGDAWKRVARTSLSAVDDPRVAGERGSSAGLYVHIPYCRRRCRYCDFAIVPIGNPSSPDDAGSDETAATTTTVREDAAGSTRQTSGFQKLDLAYRRAVLDEINLLSKTAEKGRRIPLRSIYFGGGTPSLAPLATLQSILDELLLSSESPFYLVEPNDAEITIEVDPGTFDLSKLRALKDMGFNRFSLGAQSFDDVVLESIGRVHRRADIFQSIRLLRNVCGDDANYSIDLISGLPGLSLAKWAETLETAVALRPRPSHLSLYDLQVEQGTVFGKWYNLEEEGNDADAEGEIAGLTGIDATKQMRVTQNLDLSGNEATRSHPPLPTADDCAFMYRYASGYLRSHGYEHYEISSYADTRNAETRRSQHNQIYWEIGSEWYAVGLGATSSVGGHRFARPRAMADYISWITNQRERWTQQAANVNDPKKSKEKIECWSPDWLSSHEEAKRMELERIDDDHLSDVIMTRLRTKEGLDLDLVAKWTEGYETVKAILRGASLALDLGLAERIKNGDNHGYLRLVDPDGFLFSNTIISSIFVEIDDVMG